MVYFFSGGFRHVIRQCHVIYAVGLIKGFFVGGPGT